MCLVPFMFAHSKVDIYRIPLYKVDQIIFQLFLLKKAKMRTKKYNQPTTPQMVLNPFYRWENQDKGTLKALSWLDCKQLVWSPEHGAFPQILFSFLHMSHLY